MDDLVLYEVDDPVAVVTLNRPEKLNALTYPMLAAFRSAIERAEADPRVVGIVVTGAGRGFCAGLDAEVLKQTTAPGAVRGVADPSSAEVPVSSPGGSKERLSWSLRLES